MQLGSRLCCGVLLTSSSSYLISAGAEDRSALGIFGRHWVCHVKFDVTTLSVGSCSHIIARGHDKQVHTFIGYIILRCIDLLD